MRSRARWGEVAGLGACLAVVVVAFLGSYAQHKQDHELDMALDNELIRLAEPALANGEKVLQSLPIVNTNLRGPTSISTRQARQAKSLSWRSRDFLS